MHGQQNIKICGENKKTFHVQHIFFPEKSCHSEEVSKRNVTYTKRL